MYHRGRLYLHKKSHRRVRRLQPADLLERGLRPGLLMLRIRHGRRAGRLPPGMSGGRGIHLRLCLGKGQSASIDECSQVVSMNLYNRTWECNARDADYVCPGYFNTYCPEFQPGIVCGCAGEVWMAPDCREVCMSTISPMDKCLNRLFSHTALHLRESDERTRVRVRGGHLNLPRRTDRQR